MPISVRLDSTTEQTLSRMIRSTGKTRSQLIREAIQHMSARVEAEGKPPYERMADLIGVVDRGPGDRAVRSEDLLRATFAERRARQRSQP